MCDVSHSGTISTRRRGDASGRQDFAPRYESRFETVYHLCVGSDDVSMYNG